MFDIDTDTYIFSEIVFVICSGVVRVLISNDRKKRKNWMEVATYIGPQIPMTIETNVARFIRFEAKQKRGKAELGFL